MSSRSLLLAAVFVSSIMPAPASGRQIDDDISIRYIHRTPEIDYVFGSDNPAVDGWPTAGEEVVWQAVVKNWSDVSRTDVTYQWRMDGEMVKSGFADLPASSETIVEFQWTWTFERHEVTFSIDALDEIPEFSELNNSLTIHTDAITIGYYVEQTLYDYFHEHQHELGDGANSFDDWAQRGVRILNGYAADAVFPETPEGVYDRFRLDAITVVPDGALPLVDEVTLGNATITNPIPGLVPNGDDRTVDIQFGFPVPMFGYDIYEDLRQEWHNPFWFGGVAFHEMGHARYLIDVYGFDVDHGVEGNAVLITENGELVVDTPYMPARPAVVVGPDGTEQGFQLFDTTIEGLMSSTYDRIDRYSAAAMNLIAGHRAVAGNFNAPQNLGVFMNDFPAETRVRVLDVAGVPLAGADVSVYRSEPSGPGGPYFKYYDDIPDLYLSSDEDAVVVMTGNPFGDGIIHGLGGSNAVAIVRAEHEGRVGYAFMESMYFNLEFWAGNEDTGDVELRFDMIAPGSTNRDVDARLPERVTIGTNYPNPFHNETTIPFDLSDPASVTFSVADALGRSVATLLDGEQMPAGSHRIVWRPEQASSGSYVYTLRVNDAEYHGTVILLR